MFNLLFFNSSSRNSVKKIKNCVIFGTFFIVIYFIIEKKLSQMQYNNVIFVKTNLDD